MGSITYNQPIILSGKRTNLIIILILLSSLPACDNDRPSTAPEYGGNTTLYWNPPSQYETGAHLTTGEIESYDIYWGTDTSNLTYLTTITDHSAQQTTLYNLNPGHYWFAINVKTVYGSESGLSNSIFRGIN